MCFRISEMEVEDENEIKWEDLAGGWSSVRSPQWLRSKWWSIKRQVTNHKEIPFNGTHTYSNYLNLKLIILQLFVTADFMFYNYLTGLNLPYG